MTRIALVTGGAGFIGANVVDRLCSDGWRVRILDDLSREGAADNLAWLARRHEAIDMRRADIRDASAVREAVRDTAAVIHLAGQVAVTTSLDDPMADFLVNAAGTLGLLEAARAQPTPPALLFASTNKVYGDLGDVALDLVDGRYRPTGLEAIAEARPLDPHTPYGCSKAAADSYVLDYARSFGLPAAVFRMSCIYGRRQRGGEEQGWVAHFVRRALIRAPITIYGDGSQVRDVLDVRDAVDAYVGGVAAIERLRGQAFNLGGGPRNAVSLRVVLQEIGRLVGRPPHVRFGPWRAGDQRWFVSDASRLADRIGFSPRIDWRDGLADMARERAGIERRTRITP